MALQFAPWEDKSIRERTDYTTAQPSRKHFAPEPQAPGIPEPEPQPEPRPRRSTDMQTKEYAEEARGLVDYLEDLMNPNEEERQITMKFHGDPDGGLHRRAFYWVFRKPRRRFSRGVPANMAFLQPKPLKTNAKDHTTTTIW